ncbi:MAG: hypothetical protein QOE90_2409 [Thermoplasmata archaeon]|jgi:hypothetical protein|nr:hypothetical protein [Thermoplasmata archaeon]
MPPDEAGAGLTPQQRADLFWNAAGATAGLLFGMIGQEFSEHEKWTTGASLYLVPAGLRLAVRIAGWIVCARIVWKAWRQADAALDATPAPIEDGGTP